LRGSPPHRASLGMDPNDASEWERLDRYIAGEGAAEEREATRRWIEADPERKRIADAMRSVDDLPGETAPLWSPGRAWARLSRRIGVSGDSARSSRALSPLLVVPDAGLSRSQRLLRLGVAAAAVFLAVSGIAVLRGRRAPDVAAAPPPKVFETPRGKRATIELLDGTRVALAPQSRLLVASFDGLVRNVVLDGEAVFDVRHDATKPFLVHAHNGVIEDVGTRFGVRAYPRDTLVRVIVATGAVALRPATDSSASSIVLGAGQMAALTARGVGTRVARVDAERALGWTRGCLSFRSAPLRDVAVDLGRWFDLDVSLADPRLGDRRLTIAMCDQDPTVVLGAVALPLGLRYERNGRVVVFRP